MKNIMSFEYWEQIEMHFKQSFKNRKMKNKSMGVKKDVEIMRTRT